MTWCAHMSTILAHLGFSRIFRHCDKWPPPSLNRWPPLPMKGFLPCVPLMKGLFPTLMNGPLSWWTTSSANLDATLSPPSMNFDELSASPLPWWMVSSIPPTLTNGFILPSTNDLLSWWVTSSGTKMLLEVYDQEMRIRTSGGWFKLYSICQSVVLILDLGRCGAQSNHMNKTSFSKREWLTATKIGPRKHPMSKLSLQ